MEFLLGEVKKTLKFYSIFSFSLTPLEVYKNLGVKCKFIEVVSALEELCNIGEVIEYSGYFYLSGSESLRDIRSARFLISIKKIKRARLVAYIISKLPFIRFIGICNSLGFLNAREDSDIDFFIITKSGYLWTARFFGVFLLKLFKMRPEKNNLKDKICLSFFISDKNLDISDVSLSGEDPYLYRWLSWIMPVYDDGIYQDFINKNIWIKKFLPNFIWQNNYLVNDKSYLKTFFENIFDGLEQILEKIQLKIMPSNLLKARERRDNSVVMNDKMLKLHLIDRRAEYRKKLNIYDK